MNPTTAQEMAQVLNQRGFVTHSDYSLGQDGDFGRYVCANEKLLRKHGYSGGQLLPWSTSFRLTLAFDYGVVDFDNRPPDDQIDNYVLATGSELDRSGLTGGDLQPLLIGLQYRCDCGSVTDVHPGTIPHKQKILPITQIDALCGVCKRHVPSPSDTFRLFKGYP